MVVDSQRYWVPLINWMHSHQVSLFVLHKLWFTRGNKRKTFNVTSGLLK